MIKVIEKNNIVKQEPHYRLEFNYMIGDANGETIEKMDVDIKHSELLEKFVKTIGKLKPVEGCWGVSLSEEDLTDHFNEGQIDEDEWGFLTLVMFEEYENEDFYDSDFYDEEYWGFFASCVQYDNEYTFLTLNGVKLFYVDENGVSHETEIVD